MKIFISHSSKDKWAARRISEDLVKLGAETFLDEKDIESGQSIDISIRENLKICDDFLLILSPASIKSEWVLIELGGALALEKKVVPILFYVGANEIPQAINLKLSRDINNINLYYDEIMLAISGKKAKTSKKAVSKAVFKKGEKVKVINYIPENIIRSDFLIDWEPPMNKYLNREMTINAVDGEIENAYLLDNAKQGNQYYIFAGEWLIPLQ